MKEIEGYEGLYAVTRDGKVWAYPITRVRDGRVCKYKGKWLKPSFPEDGYKTVSLWKDEKPKRFSVHRLVANAFLERLVVNHKNGIKIDNRVENLEWVTDTQNMLHAYQVLGRGAPKGEMSYCSKMTDEKVVEMRKLREQDKRKYTHKVLAEMYDIDSSVVCRIINRQAWTHV